MNKPGDVVRFWSYVAGKQKYHLCLSLRGYFLFINSPKSRMYRGDFVIPCSELPFLAPTESGKSVISCSTIVKMTDRELYHCQAENLGAVSRAVLLDLLAFVENSPVLSPDDKAAILDELGDSI